MQGSRGGFSGGGSGPLLVVDWPAGCQQVGRPAGRQIRRCPDGTVALVPAKAGWAAWAAWQHKRHPMRGMGGMRARPSSTADTRHPKGGDRRPPHRPRYPIPRIVVPAATPSLPSRRSAVRTAVEREWWRRPAVVAAARATEPAGHQLGPLRAERGGGRGRVQRLAADHRRADAPASPDAARDGESAILRHVDPALADQQPALGSGRGARAGGRGILVQPNLIATLQEARAGKVAARARAICARPHADAGGALARHRQRVLIAVINSGVDTQHPELAGMILDTFDAIGTGDRCIAHGTSIVGAIAARVAAAWNGARRAHPGRARVRHPSQQHGRHQHRHHQGDRVGDAAQRAHHQYELCRLARSGDRASPGRGAPARHHPGRCRRQRRTEFGAALSRRQSRASSRSPRPTIDDRIFRSANRGNHIAVAAPGVDLWLPTLDGGYRRTSGTSFSAAEITGVIALMLERNPGLNPEAVRRALVSTARDLGAPGSTPCSGPGWSTPTRRCLRSCRPAPAANGPPRPPGSALVSQ